LPFACAKRWKELFMRRTLVGVFDRHAQALQAAQALQDIGFGPDRVRVTDVHGSDAQEPDGADDTVSAHIRSFFAEVFGPTPDHHAAGHAELVRRGGALVRVDLEDEVGVEAARSTLQARGASRVDEHAGS
jgi:hypothetical protein